MDADNCLDETQVAELLHVTVKCLQKWRYARLGPPFLRLSRHCIRYQPEALPQWLRDHTIATRAAAPDAKGPATPANP